MTRWRWLTGSEAPPRDWHAGEWLILAGRIMVWILLIVAICRML